MLLLVACLACGTYLAEQSFAGEPSISAYHSSVNRKLALVKSLSRKLVPTMASEQGERAHRWNDSQELITQANLYIHEKQWASAEPLIDEALKILSGLRADFVRSKQQDPCVGRQARLTNSLKVVLATIQGDEIKATNSDERLAITRQLERALAKTDCKTMDQALSGGLNYIQDSYSRKLAIVKLDLSTPKKRYQYDTQRYQTYQLLYQQRRTNAQLSGDITSKADKLRQEAVKLYQQANLQAQNSIFSQAEELQTGANQKMTKALQLTGIYISE